MKKKPTKSNAVPPKKSPRKKKPVVIDFEIDPPRLMNAKQLAERYQVSHDSITLWARLPLFPKQEQRGLWPYILFDRAVAAMKEQGGPTAFREAAEAGIIAASPEASITGKVEPLPVAGETDEEAQKAGSAITPQELLKLSQKNLLRTKTAEDIITRRMANQENRRRLIPRAEVEAALHARAQRVHGLAKQFKLELVPKLVGLERPEMEKASEGFFDDFFRALAALGDRVTAPAGEGGQEEQATTPAAGNGQPLGKP